LRLCGEILLLTKRKAFWSQPPVAQQRLLNFTGGPLGISIDAPARMTNKKYLY
jgi:hypothetical protein